MVVDITDTCMLYLACNLKKIAESRLALLGG